MSVWTKINTLFRASAEESAESVVRANTMRIFAQEIRDAESAIIAAKHQLATVMAEKAKLDRQNRSLQSGLALREKQAIAALEKQQHGLAEELATLIADDEALLKEQQKQVIQLSQQEQRLKQQLKKAITAIQNYKRELNLARANQFATQSARNLQITSGGLGTAMEQMQGSLTLIQNQQTGAQDYQQALDEINMDLSGESLDKQLQKAGIQSTSRSANAVLDRLRKQSRVIEQGTSAS
ncbi:phage shock protein A (IM30) [Oleiphilus messinensis]|uniref:Phage shock protein A (IM30) n=1 Tax=Oleiphilus messinensis TaxID=141451 RepID=A0A1Y0I4Y9_9GAMM|nr:PspA/IM30 family protein [Oleiphilus messinensis]ARU54524.1 phage shock protein A (IM30) [Oleiphilus messinensis]